MDNLFNLTLMIGKKIIYQNRGRRNSYYMVHFERLMDLERESKEVHAFKSERSHKMGISRGWGDNGTN